MVGAMSGGTRLLSLLLRRLQQRECQVEGQTEIKNEFKALPVMSCLDHGTQLGTLDLLQLGIINNGIV